MYSWDHENHLTTIQKTNTSGELELVAEYVYDALGRRVGFTEYRSGVARYVREFSYDGWRQLTEIVRFGTLELYRDYAYGNRLDEVLSSRYRHSIGSLYYLHDHLNSPAALVSDYDSGTSWSAGEIAQRYEYDAYGKRYVYDADYNEKTPSVINSIGFTGQRIDLLDYDTTTSTYKHSLCYYKNRWYSPDMGRFMSNDPLGVVPEGYRNRFSVVGQYKNGINVYMYGNCNSITYVDILGLDYYGVDWVGYTATHSVPSYDQWWYHYDHGGGDPGDLEAWGYMDELKSEYAEEISTAANKIKKKVRGAARALKCSGSLPGLGYMSGYGEDGSEFPGFYSLKLFGKQILPGDQGNEDVLPVGNTTISVKARCLVVKNCCAESYCYACSMNYSVKGDAFEDPYDFFNLREKPYETGDPYPIKANWNTLLYGCESLKEYWNGPSVDVLSNGAL